ncbi:MAG: hypothetical protein NWE94_02145 [Candidatus Bathyarchaeota archaeon]|nr:hypothetical protein [Candidatus Bathyarchaeota archaeon]
MMRSVEILLVIIILAGAFIVASSFAVLPEPRQASPVNLRRLALTTLQMLDSNHELGDIVFSDNATLLSGLQVALSASLPPDVVYNLTVYEVGNAQGIVQLYAPVYSISNAESLGVSSDASSYYVTSSNATFTFTPEKINSTLYILNCSDANGWWITGYTAHSLAEDLYTLLSQYFVKTIIVQNTAQLGQILNGTSLQGETLQNAVVINTCGEAVPIPAGYYTTIGYDAARSSYANYTYTLGHKVRVYNWTWASIVGYPFYYVSNTATFNSTQNDWGIYGMRQVSQAGLNAFLRGIANQSYSYDTTDIKSSFPVVYLSNSVVGDCSYYGIYPSRSQTSTRALSTSIQSAYNLQVGLYVFDQVGNYLPGAIYNHVFVNSADITGSFLALGLTRTPDIRVTAISLLSYFKPNRYPSVYSASESSRLVVLQLGLVGGG